MSDSSLVSGPNLVSILDNILEHNQGLLRLLPSWVPRNFLEPGKRLRLHPDDLYAYGRERGGIDERWLASVTEADNEKSSPHEGLSICTCDESAFLLRDAITTAPQRLIGPALSATYGRWPVLAKLFDNQNAIPLHVHHPADAAATIGKQPKPESYYFLPQYNPHVGDDPQTYFGLKQGVSRQDVRKCLEHWQHGDNEILNLSTSYSLEKGTGWLVPPGVLHAPGSLCTYEPQWGSDVFSMFQNTVNGLTLDRSLLIKDVPPSADDEIEFLLDLLDWDANLDPDFATNHRLTPEVFEQGDGWVDRWVVYGTINNRQLFSARELTVEPKARCVLRDPGASGWLTVRGEGTIGSLPLKTPRQIRFGERTEDEVFISYDAATQGVEIQNTGLEPLVGLRYFGPDVSVLVH